VDPRGAALRLALSVALLAPAAAVRADEPDAACASELERQVLSLVNAERARLGRPALDFDVRLTAAARRHAADMRDGCFLAHTGSDGSSPRQRMAEAGYPDGMAEVAAAGSWPFPPGMVVDSWLDSPAHRAILTNTDARHLGMGYADRPASCRIEAYQFSAGGFWAGVTGDAPDSEYLDEACCPVPGGEPVCVPEPDAAAGAASAALALAATRMRRRCSRSCERD
jgi:uncharacterized protein YkwD